LDEQTHISRTYGGGRKKINEKPPTLCKKELKKKKENRNVCGG